jgi:DNA-binding NarL/FixJ family response regulator
MVLSHFGHHTLRGWSSMNPKEHPIICFIDDSDFEHDLVRSEIAPSFPEIRFIQTYTFDQMRRELRDQQPDLFLLDLWGQDPLVKEPFLTPKDELEKCLAGFNTLDQVYKGLETFPGDKANEYLKRLFIIVDSWRRLFEGVCDRIGQNRKYGLTNLRAARDHYPGVPAVFYTRKSLINDALALFQAGADGLFIKPTGNDDDETRRLTREYAPELVSGLMTFLA